MSRDDYIKILKEVNKYATNEDFKCDIISLDTQDNCDYLSIGVNKGLFEYLISTKDCLDIPFSIYFSKHIDVTINQYPHIGKETKDGYNYLKLTIGESSEKEKDIDYYQCHFNKNKYFKIGVIAIAVCSGLLYGTIKSLKK